MILLRDIDKVLTLAGAAQKRARGIQDEDLGIVEKQSILVSKNKIIWLGDIKRIPKEFKPQIKKEINLKGKTVMPSFVECHTHSVFAGTRRDEFELRNQGVSYQEIARKGGGILSTQRELDKISANKLLELTQKRVNKFIQQGVSVIEIKSGYGLDLKNEIKSLAVLKKIKGAQVIPTFLGAHGIPKKFHDEKEYLEFLKYQVLPLVKKKKLAERVDIFIEKGFFSVEAARNYLVYSSQLGFKTLIHADQLSLSGGTELACELQSLSADHVIQILDNQIKKVADSEVTCVLLPLADLYMKCSYPPAKKLIDEGARVALATDFNPGSCPSQDVMMVGLLARLEMKMTLAQVICAYTMGSSYALQLEREYGSVEVGKKASFSILSGEYQDLFYSSTDNPITERFYDSKIQKFSSIPL